jgi:uncharacterized protein DUF1801
MPPKKPSGVADLLEQIPADRRKEMARVRSVILKNLPAGYKETICKGMIVYEVPLACYPDTYNGYALWYAALGANKNSLSLHLMNVYGSPTLARKLQQGFRAAGKKLDMGKACIRFRSAEDLALDVVGDLVASTPMKTFVEAAKAARRR